MLFFLISKQRPATNRRTPSRGIFTFLLQTCNHNPWHILHKSLLVQLKDSTTHNDSSGIRLDLIEVLSRHLPETTEENQGNFNHTYIHTHTHTHIYTLPYEVIHTYILVHTHTHTHTHIYIYIYISALYKYIFFTQL